jgi:hypothetical protein
MDRLGGFGHGSKPMHPVAAPRVLPFKRNSLLIDVIEHAPPSDRLTLLLAAAASASLLIAGVLCGS